MNSKPKTSFGLAALTPMLLLVAVIATNAATLTVDNLTDNVAMPAAGSLRKVIADASDGDEIAFAAGLNGTITLAGAELDLDKDLTITGPGQGVLAVSGNDVSRVMRIPAGKTVTVTGLTIRNGKGPAGVIDPVHDTYLPAGNGGGIKNMGALEMVECAVVSNKTERGSGNGVESGIYGGGNGGGIANFGTLRMTLCTVSDNYVQPGDYRGGNGGGIFNFGSLEMTSCTVEMNTIGVTNSSDQWVGRGGGLYSVSEGGSSYTLTGCTFSNNKAADGNAAFLNPGEGGGVAGSGAAINSTFTGNRSGDGGFNGDGGGSGASGGAIFGENLILLSCTIAGNSTGNRIYPYASASTGGGVYGSGVLRNTIVAGNGAHPGQSRDFGGQIPTVNTTPAVGLDISGAFVSEGHNLIGKVDGSTGVTNGQYGDIAGTNAVPLDPKVSELADNGGPTKTMALQVNSPAIDAGDDTLTGTDQRGQPRSLGSHVDIGAIEQTDTSHLAVISFSMATSTVAEAAGNAVIAVVRSNSMDGTVTVNFSTSGGTATSGVDFASVDGTLTFGPGETLKAIPAPIVNDSANEGKELFQIILSAPSPDAVIVAPASHAVTILDDDAPGTLAFEFAASTVPEAAGNVEIKVLRTSGSVGSVSVAYATANGTATAGSDYTSKSGTLTFANGVTQQTISVPITNDTGFEADETFAVQLSAPGGGALLGGIPTNTVTIQSDDPPATIQFDVDATTVNEAAGIVLVVVKRTGDLLPAVSVQFGTSDGTAAAGSDYFASSGTQTFASGVAEQTLAIAIANDALVESAEHFEITLSAPTGGAVLGQKTSHTVSITSDDMPATIQFALAADTVAEGAGNVSVQVVRVGDPTTAVSADYATVAGTAGEGDDFIAATGTVHFAVGETTQTIAVAVSDDAFSEGAESFSIALSAPSGAVLGTPATTVVTFTDDDAHVAENAGYHGLASRRDARGFGGITVTTTAAGRLTGKLKLDGATHLFAGRIAADGTFTKAIGFGARHMLTLQPSSDGALLRGTFKRGDGVLFDIAAECDLRSDTPATQRGKYTSILRNDDADAVRAVLLAKVSETGAVQITGCLPDGTPLAAGGRISETGGLTVFAPTDVKNAGYLAGNARFDEPGDQSFAGGFAWNKRPKRTGAFASGVENLPLYLAGAPYAHAPGASVMDDLDASGGAGNVRFSGGNLSGEIVHAFTMSLGNLVTLPHGAGKPRINFRAGIGLFSGTFQHTDKQRRPFKGVVVQAPGAAADIAEGFFIDNDTAGLVELLVD